MNIITKYKDRIYLIVLVFLVTFLTVFSIVILNFQKSSLFKGINTSYAGVIVEINDRGLVIQTRSGRRQSVLFLENTKILKGSMYSVRDELSIGEYAIVIGNIEPSGVIDAKILRVLKSKLNE